MTAILAAARSVPSPILLCTINAKYIHASLGLRYLLANLGDLQQSAKIAEFVIAQRPLDIVEAIIAHQPRIVGLGVYIWNVEQTTQVVAILKRVAPEVCVIIGGPEVSYEFEEQQVFREADYLITGQADFAFAQLCRALLAGHKPPVKVHQGGELATAGLAMPYQLYGEDDIAHRLIYVEASRGCPFKCEFCLSSLDTTARPFELDRFLAEMDALHQRGVRHFKFVDRTFNLAPATSAAILQFFLERLDDRLFLHFELVPDRLPAPVAQLLAKFPPGAVQLEIGVQSFNPLIQKRISRQQDDARTVANLTWLRQHTQAHLHVDLIVGLPGEDMDSFAAGFDKLVALQAHEIQIGILKRLRGTPIGRHAEEFGMVFNPSPPYNLLASNQISFQDMQRLVRVARYWDLVGNSGRFPNAKVLLLGEAPFARLLAFSDWVYAYVAKTHEFAVGRLFQVVRNALTEHLGVAVEDATAALKLDSERLGVRDGFQAQPSKHDGSRSTADIRSDATHRTRQKRFAIQ